MAREDRTAAHAQRDGGHVWRKPCILARAIDYFRYARPIRATYIRPDWQESPPCRGQDAAKNGLIAAKKLICISGLLTDAAGSLTGDADKDLMRFRGSFEKAKDGLNGLLQYINKRPRAWELFDDRAASNFRSIIKDFQHAEIALQKAGRMKTGNYERIHLQNAALAAGRAADTLDAMIIRASGKLQR